MRDFTEETVSSYELMLDEIAEANQVNNLIKNNIMSSRKGEANAA